MLPSSVCLLRSADCSGLLFVLPRELVRGPKLKEHDVYLEPRSYLLEHHWYSACSFRTGCAELALVDCDIVRRTRKVKLCLNSSNIYLAKRLDNKSTKYRPDR